MSITRTRFTVPATETAPLFTIDVFVNPSPWNCSTEDAVIAGAPTGRGDDITVAESFMTLAINGEIRLTAVPGNSAIFGDSAVICEARPIEPGDPFNLSANSRILHLNPDAAEIVRVNPHLNAGDEVDVPIGGGKMDRCIVMIGNGTPTDPGDEVEVWSAALGRRKVMAADLDLV